MDTPTAPQPDAKPALNEFHFTAMVPDVREQVPGPHALPRKKKIDLVGDFEQLCTRLAYTVDGVPITPGMLVFLVQGSLVSEREVIMVGANGFTARNPESGMSGSAHYASGNAYASRSAAVSGSMGLHRGVCYRIDVNGKELTTDHDELTYEEVCRLAGYDPETMPTCTWHRRGSNCNGILHRRGKVLIQDNTYFSCIHTGNA